MKKWAEVLCASYLNSPLQVLTERGDSVGRALGALICIACAVVAIVELWFGLVDAQILHSYVHKAIGLPVVVGVLVICGLGFWLGWIMATTKEVAPAPVEASKEKEAE
jgi:hypothetical protein